MRLLACVVLLWLSGMFLSASAQSIRDCYRTSIQEPVPFMGNGGETLIMADGTIWKDTSYMYLYLYEYNPTVILCPKAGLMMFKGKEFTVVPVGRLQRLP